MKKLLIGAVSAVALSFAFAVMPATANHGGDANAICKAFGDLGADNHGRCVSALNTGDVRFCSFLRDVAPVGYENFFGSRGLGPCIQFFKNH